MARASQKLRLAISALVVIVAAPAVPVRYILAWLLAYLIVSIVEQVTIGRRGYIGRDFPSLFVTFAVSALHAAAAAALIHLGDGGARFFAVALIGFSAINILLRLYSSPRLFIAALAPHAMVLTWVTSTMFARHLAEGAYLKLLTPPAVLLTYALLLLPTRARLAEAWNRLVAAKSEAEAASRAKSDFLATMSHEIRTPLNGILGMAQALQAGDLTQPQKDQLRLIRRSGETLLCILNDALDFSRIEAGELVIENAPFDLEHAARGAAATFAPLAAKKALSFEFSIADPAKGVFLGDSVRLRQVLYNLVSNAVKFTESGGVGVCVSYEAGALTLEVADSGCGIAPERIEGLFEKFVQGDASATRRHGGAGLGLSITRQLTELMGGRIEVSSAVGKGSIFKVVLPFERLSDPQQLAAPAAQPLALPVTPIRILAAEDNEVNQLVLKTLLSQVGLDPVMVENGALALEAWEEERWDLILVDVQMPVMDGVTAAREIRVREARERRARTPIIAVTANATPQQIADYLSVGIDEVVPKPLDAVRLFRAIDSALGARREPARTKAAAA